MEGGPQDCFPRFTRPLPLQCWERIQTPPRSLCSVSVAAGPTHLQIKLADVSIHASMAHFGSGSGWHDGTRGSQRLYPWQDVYPPSQVPHTAKWNVTKNEQVKRIVLHSLAMLLGILSHERLVTDTVCREDICCHLLNDAAIITHVHMDRREEAMDSCKSTFTFWAHGIAGPVFKVSSIFRGVAILNYARVDRTLEIGLDHGNPPHIGLIAPTGSFPWTRRYSGNPGSGPSKGSRDPRCSWISRFPVLRASRLRICTLRMCTLPSVLTARAQMRRRRSSILGTPTAPSSSPEPLQPSARFEQRQRGETWFLAE